MNTTETRDSQPVGWTARCNLAASILNHRDPSEHTVRMATLALTGASITDMLEVDAFPHMMAGLAPRKRAGVV